MTARNEVIRKIIDYIPDEKIQFCKNLRGETELYFPDRNSMMTILEENTWEELKRIIDSKTRHQFRATQCEICLHAHLMQRASISCSKCAKRWCVGCNIKMFKNNKGLSKCPYCRYAIGVVIPDMIVEMGVAEMLGRWEPDMQKIICDQYLCKDNKNN